MSIRLFKPVYDGDLSLIEPVTPNEYDSLADLWEDYPEDTPGTYFIQWPNSCIGYGASDLEYSNAESIERDYPDSIQSAHSHGVLTPMDMFRDSDGFASDALTALIEDSPIYNDDDYHERVHMSKYRYLVATVENSLWVADSDLDYGDVALTVETYNSQHDWSAWPEIDGTDYYLSDENYAPLWAHIKTVHGIIEEED